jgi:hypothetical protein
MKREFFEKYNVDGVLMSIHGTYDRAGRGPYWCGRWMENGKRRYRHFGKVDPRPHYQCVLVTRRKPNAATRTVSVYEPTFHQIHALAEQYKCSIPKVLLQIVGDVWQQGEERGA